MMCSDCHKEPLERFAMITDLRDFSSRFVCAECATEARRISATITETNYLSNRVQIKELQNEP